MSSFIKVMIFGFTLIAACATTIVAILAVLKGKPNTDWLIASSVCFTLLSFVAAVVFTRETTHSIEFYPLGEGKYLVVDNEWKEGQQ